MVPRLIFSSLGAGLLLLGCGGGPSGTTSTTTQDLASGARGGGGHRVCAAPDGGRSPCPHGRGDGGDDMDEMGDDDGGGGGDMNDMGDDDGGDDHARASDSGRHG
ncbi:MAG TPA: hypothetical protein VKU41_07825 [Polyangiaceae bacterium]|nr:hypothetical protein [Polyangiaceae bacterium]